MARNEIFTLIRNGQLDKLKEQLAGGADLHQTGKLGYNALHQAAKYGHPQIVSYLVEAGLDPQSQTKRQETVLHVAAEHGQLDVIEQALQLELPVDALDGYGYSPLYKAVNNRHCEASRLLIAAGADVNLAANEEKRSPLLRATLNDDAAMVALLVEHGADVQACDKFGDSVLSWAAKYSSLGLIQYLLDHGAYPMAKSGREDAMLAMAQGNNVEGAKLLLQRGADINGANAYGRTPLMHAIWMRNAEFVAFLLEEGADLYVEDHQSRSAFAYAESSGRADIMAMLRAEEARRGGPPKGAPAPKTGRDLVLRYLDEQVKKKVSKIVLDLDEIADNLDEVPSEIGDYPAIVEVNANNTKITTFPPSIGRLQNLKKLSAVNTPLCALPEEIGRLQKLESFVAFASRLEALPESIGELKKLRVLHVSGRLQALPETIGGCSGLKQLLVGGNRLRDLPASLSRLANLTELNLAGNELQSIPEPVFSLGKLKTLKLSNNNITTLPDRFLELTSLKQVTLSGNPSLSSPPFAVAKQGVAAIREYIGARQSEVSREESAPQPGAALRPAHLTQLEAHVEKYVGRIGSVWHELVSDDIHIDVFWVKATKRRPFHVLVTSGLSAKPMQVPEGAEEYQLAELLLCLPRDWPLEAQDLEDETAYWPIRLLKETVRYVDHQGTWIAPGHTLEREEPQPGTRFPGWLVWWPLRFDRRFHVLPLPGGQQLNFYSVIPLLRSELELKLKDGLDALLERLGAAGVSEVIDPSRREAAVSTS